MERDFSADETSGVDRVSNSCGERDQVTGQQLRDGTVAKGLSCTSPPDTPPDTPTETSPDTSPDTPPDASRELSAELSVGVVIATFNRATSLGVLLADLAVQVVDRPFRVLVIDDGGSVDLTEAITPTMSSAAFNAEAPPVASAERPVDLRLVRRDNGGPGAARHTGIELLDTDIVVIVDDDMRVGPGFVQAHLDAHRGGAEVVYGWIDTDRVADEPLFTRYHQRAIDQAIVEYRAGAVPSGARLCTGNVSFRRGGYQAVGGFDLALVRCEDRDLGIRMEAAGQRFVLADEARSEHRSDHESVSAWRRRNAIYGRSDVSIARKHPLIGDVSPWAFFGDLPALVRPVLVAAAMFPALTGPMGAGCYALALRLDRPRPRLAMTLVGLCYALDYYGGVGLESGGPRATLRSWRQWRAR